MTKITQLLCKVLFLLMSGTITGQADLISEFQPNLIGTDPDPVLFELRGTPGQTFSGWIVGIESDAGGTGTVDRASEVTGTFDTDGLLTVSVPDLENPSFTIVLSSEFTGTLGTSDIDADDDGIADDISFLGTIYDAIGVPDAAGDEANLYGADFGGTDFKFTGDEPRLMFRSGSTGELYAINDPDNGEVYDVNATVFTAADFDADPTAGTDTFGAINPSRAGIAPFDLRITEIWSGQDGTDVTADWFEIYNAGAGAWVSGTDSDLYYDDESADSTEADLIDGLTDIQPGESVIIAVGSAADTAAFSSVWNPSYMMTGIEIGFTDGAGLGGGGDAVNLWVDVPSDTNVPVATGTYPDTAGNDARSYDLVKAAFSVPDNGTAAPGTNTAKATIALGGDAADTPAVASPGNQGPIIVSAGAPTIVVNRASLTPLLSLPEEISGSISGTIDDPTDPASILGIPFTIADDDTAVGDLTVTVTSNNPSVVPDTNIELSGREASRLLKITPVGVGSGTITVTVTDTDSNSGSYSVQYAASAAAVDPAASRFHTASSDGSTAIPIDADFMWVGDDENQTLRLYNRNTSGLPINEIDFNTALGSTDEIDIEGSLVTGNTIYWTGSLTETDRSVLFSTTLSGAGAGSQLTYVDKYIGLRDDIIAWDTNNGHGFGAGFYGLTTTLEVEALALEPGSNTTAYIGLRSTVSGGKALIVPVTNFTSLPGAAADSSVFGTPIELDLRGRSLRSLDCNENGCLLIAGPVGSVSDFKLYTWTGEGTDAPELRSANLSLNSDGSFEGIVGLPTVPFLGNDGDAQSVQLLIDLGATTIYNDGVENKDQRLQWKKFQTEIVALGSVTVPSITDPLINEFVVDDPGTDDFEFIEIFGDPNTDYSGHTLLQIEGDSGAGSGTVDSVFPLDVTDANGLWTTDLFFSNEFENGSITFLLVRNFTGSDGDDLDTDDDGVLDITPWDDLVDSVGKNDSDSEFVYSPINLSPNYDGISFEVGGASRIPNGTNTNTITDWVRNDFDGAGIPDQEGSPMVGEAFNTPGAINRLVPPPGPDLQITEIWSGNLNGNNLTEDWFEITNKGTLAWTTELGELYFDDDSQDPNTADLINGIVSIEPGESIIAIDDADSDNFVSVWGGVYELTDVQIGTYAGAGLSAGGDGVTLFQGEPSIDTLIDFEEYPDVAGAPGASYDVDKAGFSVVGEAPFEPVATAPNNLDESAVGSPGNRGPVVTATVVKIHEVQGDGAVAALDGRTVTVNAIVVGAYQDQDQLSGFFVQEEDADADGDADTSEGIFVYCDTCAESVAVGDEVEVTGLAEEFFNMTQLDVTEPGGKVVVLSSGNDLPTPASVDLPSDGSTAAETTFEKIEGMLVNFTDKLFVSEYFELGRYGQLILTADARPRQFTDRNEPDVNGYASFLENLERKRIILDDDNNIQNDALGDTDEPYFWPRPGLSNTNLIRGGDEIDGLTGIMHWSFAGQQGTDAWRIRPVEPAFDYAFTSNNPRQDAPNDVGGTLKVASFNVLNYFTTLDERGADSTAELDRQRTKIADAICAMDADIVGLIEIENNGLTALNDLLNGVNGINSACGPYAAIETGVIGTDQISVAFIYNTDTVEPIGNFAILDSSVDPRFIDTKNRPALAQTFMETASSEVLTVVVNHLKSKGSPCTDVGDPNLNDGSTNCNRTRTDAAAAMVDWLATDPTASADTDFLIIGDLNAYRKETPIDTIKLGADDTAGTDDDYVDLIDANLGADGYSYVFDGQRGYLDYALANTDLADQVTGITEWHINADEINLFDYNDVVQDAGEQSFERESNALPIYEPNAFRASDHDPVLVGLQLVPSDVVETPILTVTKLVLVNAYTNEDIMEIVEGTVIDLSSLTTNKLTIRADVTDDVKSVYFELSGAKYQRKVENLSPYSLFGNFKDYYAGERFGPGSYRIKATPYSKVFLRGTRGEGSMANFSIIRGDLPDIETAKISPNPADDFTKISFDGPAEVEHVLLYNSFGWLVRWYNGNNIKDGDEYILNLDYLRRGVYVIIITDNYGNKATRKLIIK